MLLSWLSLLPTGAVECAHRLSRNADVAWSRASQAGQVPAVVRAQLATGPSPADGAAECPDPAEVIAVPLRPTSSILALGDVNSPSMKAAPSATPASTTASLIRCLTSTPPAAAVCSDRRDRPGSSAVRRVAIVVASANAQTLMGMPAMVLARLVTASALGSRSRRPASRHGSLPSRAKTETKLSVMPLRSMPTGANRKSFRPEALQGGDLGILHVRVS